MKITTSGSITSTQLIDAQTISKQFGIDANFLNFILTEFGLLTQNKKGWVATTRGLDCGAINTQSQAGFSEVLWPSSILENRFFLKTVEYLIDVFQYKYG